MKKKTLILSLMLFMAIVNTKAQSIYVYFTDGNINEYPLSEVRKITFSGTDMLLHKTDATVYTWATSDIKKYIYDNSSGIETLDKEPLDVNIYPNPSKNEFNVDYQIKENGIVNISILSIDGTIVKNLLSENKLKGRYNLNYQNNLQTGCYFVRIQNEKNITTKKLIILK